MATGTATAMNRRALLAASLLPLASSVALADATQKERSMNEPRQRVVEANGIRLNIAEQGEGPLVLLCHGFPESWYSWRHQFAPLAAAGFHVVAPDMRGYGKSDRPQPIDQYTLFHLIGDLVGLVEALGARSAVIVGHDWCASVAWHAAQLRPDRFSAVVGLSVPFRPRGKAPPTTQMPKTADAQFYQLYFQEPGVAEAELERDPRVSLGTMLYGASGDAPRANVAGIGMVQRGSGFLRGASSAPPLPAWLTERDVDFYADEFRRSGFRGALNWYRNIDRNWELLAPFDGAPVTVPALYIAGDADMVVAFSGMDQLLANLKRFVPGLRRKLMLSGCGHWTQQERPAEVNAALIEFLRSLPS
jgi:pimeloyl-ACP methyl ester carboxylesterase